MRNTNACLYSIDSYIGMDQQQDMKLDVKEAAAVPAEHPQWDLSDSDTDNNDQVSSVKSSPTSQNPYKAGNGFVNPLVL